ncbi:MAG: Bax inhibitor-1/YccA family protein [Deltaproteobacteria bacterium]|nr:Bax inhibitor-1/YccA family protein [Deltaproteobacteria bacterium]
MAEYMYKQRIGLAAGVDEFVRSVYNWMALGLAITGGVAFFTASSPSLMQMIFGNPMVLIILIVAELGMVFSLAGMINRIKGSTASTLFVIYSILNGLTLSAIFIMYTRSSIASTFFVCSATFVATSLYGYTTKKDLTSFGGFFFMGLIGIIIASLVNLFLHSETIYWVVTYAGVIVFVGLTAYDTQKIKQIAAAGFEDEEMEHKGAVLGALTLYLDFINLFLMLLRILGGRRD